MGRRTDNLPGLVCNPLETEIRGGFFVLAHALVGVAQGASLSRQPAPGGNVARLIVGPGSWLRATLLELASSGERDYILRGGIMEFDSTGPLHVLWTRLGVEEPGGTLVLAARKPESGLLLVDVTFHADVTRAPLEIVFKQVSRLTVTYDEVANITLIGVLGAVASRLDGNVWAVVRVPGNACGLSAANSECIQNDCEHSVVYMKTYVSENSEDSHIIIRKISRKI
ncbi:hypothetical protein [Komagataeibacter sucrofermentans]|uniref:hypothetical protein n=1 Tax=Komagataeibacter sucrofermentans TaxID=1053551 RepID=UPI0011B36CA1|nr:hypothetical protein [Komagataeibacter sucrofermentans]GBQ53286.1 hypothetical protein AA15973_2974 [Komagataeibacter sucrofermentans DSM 15973]